MTVPTVVAELNANLRTSHVNEKSKKWRNCYPLQQHLGEQEGEGYLEHWVKALR